MADRPGWDNYWDNARTIVMEDAMTVLLWIALIILVIVWANTKSSSMQARERHEEMMGALSTWKSTATEEEPEECYHKDGRVRGCYVNGLDGKPKFVRMP